MNFLSDLENALVNELTPICTNVSDTVTIDGTYNKPDGYFPRLELTTIGYNDIMLYLLQ